MNTLGDIITYVRRIIKSPSDAEITDNLIIDYINRFWIMDMDARLQLFDLKTKYQFQTVPGVDKYNMPLYSVQTQPGDQQIASFPVYQGFVQPARVNGIEVPFYTQTSYFFNIWPNYIQTQYTAGIGNGTSGPYTLDLAFNQVPPSVNNSQFVTRGHIDIAGIIATGSTQDPPVNNNLLVDSSPPYNGNSIVPTTSVDSQVFVTSIDTTGAPVVVADSGQLLTGNLNYGLLMVPGTPPFGNSALPGGYSTTSNTVNYASGTLTVTFPTAIPSGQNINTQCVFYQTGLPRGILFFNNCLTLRVPPAFQYLVELDAYLTPAAFLSTSQAIPYGYMAEYIARGAARKILSDTGDTEQFAFYEPLFIEQERLVWKRSQRQFTATKTQCLYFTGYAFGSGNNYQGQGNI